MDIVLYNFCYPIKLKGNKAILSFDLFFLIVFLTHVYN